MQTISLWDKLTQNNLTPTHIPSDDDGDDDDDNLLHENDPTGRDYNDKFDIADDALFSGRIWSRHSKSRSDLDKLQQQMSLWNPEEYDQIKLIMYDMDEKVARDKLQRLLSSQGIRRMASDDDRPHLWHFGLSFVRFELERPQSIDIMRLTSILSTRLWLRFGNKIQRKRHIRSNHQDIKPIRYKNSVSCRVTLRYGALTKPNEFLYSPSHKWSNQQGTQWSLFIKNKYNGGYIEWVIEEIGRRRKKQLLVMNIDHIVLIHLLPDGFVLYICQTCNMNEFTAAMKFNNVVRRNDRPPQPGFHPGLVCPVFTNYSSPQSSYEKDKRSSIRDGIYFPTVQFELRIDPNQTTDRKAQSTVQQTYKSLIEFFMTHNITICYGAIKVHQGREINSLPLIKLPTFIMNYSYQMLMNIGYRLQLQVDEQFLEGLSYLSREELNADDLFYRVCVYLSRLFSLEPFVNLSDKLHEAVTESKRKREDCTFGLISSLNTQSNTETYVPSITLTPTTIRIKPLKLCRTNRVLRAEHEFGKPLEHFALVEIRDENGQSLQSFHFRDLNQYFRDYLEHGFALKDNRLYRYLHHSQSQLRACQFWFYYHEPDLNLSFDDAYRWMGNFDKERNRAKYASRMALCFSTTTPAIDVMIFCTILPLIF